MCSVLLIIGFLTSHNIIVSYGVHSLTNQQPQTFIDFHFKSGLSAEMIIPVRCFSCGKVCLKIYNFSLSQTYPFIRSPAIYGRAILSFSRRELPMGVQPIRPKCTTSRANRGTVMRWINSASSDTVAEE